MIEAKRRRRWPHQYEYCIKHWTCNVILLKWMSSDGKMRTSSDFDNLGSLGSIYKLRRRKRNPKSFYMLIVADFNAEISYTWADYNHVV
ncbi:hypothetical protein RB195_024097 [Necator americanus]|uniref:PiggyBac transposable element-derived protein domain-containing protein n=1 Tax=Necator americanus TaxID=51031 RepID=A0ABR1EP68_NECAM